MSQWGSKFIVWHASYSIRYHSNDRRNEKSSHNSKPTAWQLLTWWNINTTVFRYSSPHNGADHHIGLQAAIKSTRISQRVLGTVLQGFDVFHPWHLNTILWNHGLLLEQLGLLMPHVHAVWGDWGRSSWKHDWMNKGREFVKHGGGKVSRPCDVGGSGSDQRWRL